MRRDGWNAPGAKQMMVTREREGRIAQAMSSQETPTRWLASALIALAAAVAVVAIGVFALHVTGGGSDGSETVPEVAAAPAGTDLPEYVMAAGDPTATAYRFALDRPDVMMWMPCYCGCGGHSGHKNARDCFVQPESTSSEIKFDEHGASCDVCVDIALRAREMTLAGSPLWEIRAAVDAEFGDIGPGTDTPLPPE
jgi:hypothetical protein